MTARYDYRAITEQQEQRIKELEARVKELERDNKGWEDECRLFKSQRDELEIQLSIAREKLHLIGDFAHQRSAGPAIGDDLWWIRCQAYETI
jgi:predicted RNase H-like nuclease (RuvC/YqgF family)